MLKQFEFDEKVALEAILYIANRSQHPDFMHVHKLLYFADKVHLAKYGRFICGDSYIAMKDGPVPSNVYDMLKAVRDGYWKHRFDHLDAAFQVESKFMVKALRAPDLEWLSDSDILCLDEAIERYDKFSYGELSQKSHGLAWKSANENNEISIEAIVNEINNPPGLLEYLRNPAP